MVIKRDLMRIQGTLNGRMLKNEMMQALVDLGYLSILADHETITKAAQLAKYVQEIGRPATIL